MLRSESTHLDGILDGFGSSLRFLASSFQLIRLVLCRFRFDVHILQDLAVLVDATVATAADAAPMRLLLHGLILQLLNLTLEQLNFVGLFANVREERKVLLLVGDEGGNELVDVGNARGS